MESNDQKGDVKPLSDMLKDDDDTSGGNYGRPLLLQTMDGNKNPMVIPRKRMRHKQAESELILSKFWYTVIVERFDRKRIDIDGKLLTIIEKKKKKKKNQLQKPLCIFGSLETVLPGSWQSIKAAEIAFF